MQDLAKKWFELEFCFGPAASHARRSDLRKGVDWDDLESYVRVGGLATACAMLEAAGLKGRDDHVRLLFELRNAVIHNSGDIAKNKNREAFDTASSYLAGSRHLELSDQLTAPFFKLEGTSIQLQSNLYYAIRLYFLFVERSD